VADKFHNCFDSKRSQKFGFLHYFGGVRKDSEFSHIDENGRPTMVDVGGKAPTRRQAIAEAKVFLPPEMHSSVLDGSFLSAKGPVFPVASMAGIQAAKKTWELIPLCHPLGLDHCQVDCRWESPYVIITATAACTHKTGVEMEALTAASVAALTVYDMGKALSHAMRIESVRLLAKSGGKRDFDDRTPSPETAK
jgi:cyclic pyranopterin phosphate synthase